MPFIKVLSIILLASFSFISISSAELSGKNSVKGKDIIAKKGSSWYYAVIIVGGGRKKLYAKGDIIYSEPDAANCMRIEEINKHSMILKELHSGKIVALELGSKVPLEGTDMLVKEIVEEPNVVK